MPGLCSRQHKEHARDEGVMERWAALLEAAEAGAQGGDTGAKEAAQALGALRAEIPAFVDQFEEHLQGEEAHLQVGGRGGAGQKAVHRMGVKGNACAVPMHMPRHTHADTHASSTAHTPRPCRVQRAGRKQMNIDLQKAMLRRIWEATPVRHCRVPLGLPAAALHPALSGPAAAGDPSAASCCCAARGVGRVPAFRGCQPAHARPARQGEAPSLAAGCPGLAAAAPCPAPHHPRPFTRAPSRHPPHHTPPAPPRPALRSLCAAGPPGRCPSAPS